MSGRAGSTGLKRCTDRYSANNTGPTVNAARCNADGARNPQAATVSRRRSGDAARLQPASSAASGPSAASPSRTASQGAMPASIGLALSSTQRPGPRRTATTARTRPPTSRLATPEPSESAGTTSAPRAIGASAPGAERVSGTRAAASCMSTRTSESQRSVAPRPARRNAANPAPPTQPLERRGGKRGCRGVHQRRGPVVDLEPLRESGKGGERPRPDQELKQVVPAAGPGHGRDDRQVPSGGGRVAGRENPLEASARPSGGGGREQGGRRQGDECSPPRGRTRRHRVAPSRRSSSRAVAPAARAGSTGA